MALGVIGGSSFLQSEHIKDFQKLTVDTEHGQVVLRANAPRTVFFVQRHAANPQREYSPPHLINKKAIAVALQKLGCSLVIGFGSVGSLQESIPVGTLLVPHDYVNLWTPITLFDDARGHLIPGFNEPLRQRIVSTLQSAGFTVTPKGVYVQSQGPRFETPAEIQAMKGYSDVVGMTCAHEAALFAELKLPFAIICMVDNMANGITADKPLTVAGFHEGVRQHADVMLSVLATVISNFSVPAVAAEEKLGKEVVDLLVTGSYVVTMSPHVPDVLTDHTVVVQDGKIVAVLPEAEATARFAARETVNLAGHVLMPGLVNAHTHLGMTMLRGYSDDKALMPWLQEDIWPAEAHFLCDEFVFDNVLLGMAEMIRGGTTACNDMFLYAPATARAADQAGVRAMVGLAVLDFPSSYASGPEDYFAKGEQVMQKYVNHPRIGFTQAPHAPFTVCDENLAEVNRRAMHWNMPIHIHLHETRDEVEHSLEAPPPEGVVPKPARHRSRQVCRPFANLDRLGLADQGQRNSSMLRAASPDPAAVRDVAPNRLIAVHMTQLTEEEIQICADPKRRIHVVHCPASNMKLASGICPVTKLLAAGANVALGTDSTASNNSLDMFWEMRLASLLQKSATSNATSLPAYQTLQLATVNGARALGLQDVIGSLEAGKSADFIAVKFSDLETMPVFSVISHLAYCCGRDKVTDVWVQGRRLLNSRRLTTIDEEQLKAKVAKWNVELIAFRDSRQAALAQGSAAAPSGAAAY